MEREFNTSGLEQLPYEKLFEIAEQKFNELDYEEAEIYYEAAYKKKPMQDMIVLCYSHILKQNQNVEKAKNILEESIKVNPNGTFKRYFELAEIHNGEASINIFEKGIQQALACLSNPFLNNAPSAQIKRDIAQAYASIAQICMTDLSHLPYQNVEKKCIQVLQKGKEIDPNCMDIHLQTANCLIEKDQNQQAKNELFIIKETFMGDKQELEDELVLQCAKYFMQVGEHQQSIQILEKLNESQNNSPQIVYLLAFCAFQMKKFQLCKEYIHEYPEGQTDDPEVAQAMKELREQLAKNVTLNDETEQGMEDDEWEDVDQEMEDQ